MSLEWYGDKLTAKAHAAALTEIRRQAEAVLTEAKKQVPVDTGTLMRSGHTTKTATGSRIEFSVSYALRIHEHGPTSGTTRVTKRQGRGNAKYLETPLLGMAPRMFDAMCSAIRKAMGG